MNLWHDVPLGDNAPEEFNVIIETPKGSLNKYEIDKETGLIKLDRANYSAAAFPSEYGFAPQTLWEDDDALDIVLMATFPIPSGIMVKVRPVALIEMIDNGGNPDWYPTVTKAWKHMNEMRMRTVPHDSTIFRWL